MALTKNTYFEITDKHKQQDKANNFLDLFVKYCLSTFFCKNKNTIIHFLIQEYFAFFFFFSFFCFDITNSIHTQSTSPPALLKASKNEQDGLKVI